LIRIEKSRWSSRQANDEGRDPVTNRNQGPGVLCAAVERVEKKRSYLKVACTQYVPFTVCFFCSSPIVNPVFFGQKYRNNACTDFSFYCSIWLRLLWNQSIAISIEKSHRRFSRFG
jgi:hypothetical protein